MTGQTKPSHAAPAMSCPALPPPARSCLALPRPSVPAFPCSVTPSLDEPTQSPGWPCLPSRALSNPAESSHAPPALPSQAGLGCLALLIQTGPCRAASTPAKPRLPGQDSPRLTTSDPAMPRGPYLAHQSPDTPCLSMLASPCPVTPCIASLAKHGHPETPQPSPHLAGLALPALPCRLLSCHPMSCLACLPACLASPALPSLVVSSIPSPARPCLPDWPSLAQPRHDNPSQVVSLLA
jgi:hypothetical protein